MKLNINNDSKRILMNTFNDALFNDNVYFDIDDKGNTKLVWDNVKINFTNNP